MPWPLKTCAFGAGSKAALLFIISLLLNNFLTALSINTKTKKQKKKQKFIEKESSILFINTLQYFSF